MIWIPIVIAVLTTMRCIALEKRLRRLNERIRRLRIFIESQR